METKLFALNVGDKFKFMNGTLYYYVIKKYRSQRTGLVINYSRVPSVRGYDVTQDKLQADVILLN